MLGFGRDGLCVKMLFDFRPQPNLPNCIRRIVFTTETLGFRLDGLGMKRGFGFRPQPNLPICLRRNVFAAGMLGFEPNGLGMKMVLISALNPTYAIIRSFA